MVESLISAPPNPVRFAPLKRLPPRMVSRLEKVWALAVGARILAKICMDRVVHRDGVDRSFAVAGRLALGAMLAKRGQTDFASSVLGQVPDPVLARYILPEAAIVMAESDPNRVASLLALEHERWVKIRSRLSFRSRLFLAISSAYVGDTKGVEIFAENTGSRGDILKRLFSKQVQAASELGVCADYHTVRKAALCIGNDDKAPSNQDRNTREASVQQAHYGAPQSAIGLLDYCRPAMSSINLGDYLQTIAMIGQLSRFCFDSLAAPDVVRDLLSQGRYREGEAVQTIATPIEIVPVNRDFPLASATSGPIWLPVCCWYGDRAYPGQFDFPLPGNIRPLFMALHIARPEILNDETLAYLRRFEPIGCRDLFTARLLRGAGVKAFFNGCVTMTLDRLRQPHAGPRAGRYHALHTTRNKLEYKPSWQEGGVPTPHNDDACLMRDFDGNLRAAMGLLDKYHMAAEVRTGLVHCWLPCRAMGVPVTLTEELSRADPRLDGLIELDDAAFRNAAGEFEAVAQPVLAAILEEKSETEVYSLWREVAEPAMARTDALIAERNAKYPLQKIQQANLELDQIPVRVFGPASEPDGTVVQLLFAFDEKIAEFFPGTFEGVWRHASRPLVVHIFGRGLNAAMFERWAVLFPGVRFVWRDLSGFTYGDGLRLINDTTVSTMDRLLSPALLPDVEKIVYLDLDILVRKDIADLFDMDLGDAPLAARRNDVNAYVRIGAKSLYAEQFGEAERAREAFRNAFFSDGPTVFEGFNAGVLTLSLARMRREQMVEKTLALVQTCGVNDQTALNLTTRGRWKPLAQERVLLFVVNRFQEDPAIVHFTGIIKPWTRRLSVLSQLMRVVSWACRNGRTGLTDYLNEWWVNARRARARE